MKKFSSGALTKEQKALQDEHYRDRHAAGVEYDYLNNSNNRGQTTFIIY